jgi:hypothetical protein
LYKGRRRSHRFTILGDTAFEYDCILEREPESNVISLLIEGAEHFDFYRQPEFVKEPFLKGSYAVYKKETLIGEGTGKLCHIHRPQIIDARGRRCWGDLHITENMLHITIPEKWLSGAKYPVIVDPTIGTTTVGSQYLVEFDPPDDPWIDLIIDCMVAVNRFSVPETVNGTCTAYVYTNEDMGEDAGGRGVVYSDNGNTPYARLSAQEDFINLKIGGGNPKGWRTGAFKSSGSIAAGSSIWFGVAASYFWFPRFDYGFRSVMCEWDPRGAVPDVFGSRAYEENYKFSMYFNYTSAQHYIRTITQGAGLSDSLKRSGDYTRCLPETAGVHSHVTRYQSFLLKVRETLLGYDRVSTAVLFARFVNETIINTDVFRRIAAYMRGLSDTAGTEGKAKSGWVFSAVISDNVYAAGSVFRGLLLCGIIFWGGF